MVSGTRSLLYTRAMILPAQHAPCLTATLGKLAPLRFKTAPAGLPSYVRSASALRRWNSGLVIVQDDVHALGFLNSSGELTSMALPRIDDGALLFDDSHGNKLAKLDLESALSLPDGRLMAFGSGATPRRERIVVMNPAGAARVVDAAPLYAMFRAERAFSGYELNIEGAVLVAGTVRFFQRGNGARNATQLAVNAIGDISLGNFLEWLDRNGPLPEFLRITQVDLGEIRGVRFGFTDATPTVDGGIAFLACAEDSDDAVSDGPVLGCRFGLLRGDEITLTDVVDGNGQPVAVKLEGIENRPDGTCYDVVADQDLPGEPALLGMITVSTS